MKIKIYSLSALILAAACGFSFAAGPEAGRITGYINGAKTDITVDREAGTVRGFINDGQVDMLLAANGARVTGVTAGQPVRVSFEGGAEKFSYFGGMGVFALDLKCDMRAGLLDGYFASGFPYGASERMPVRLVLKDVNGKIGITGQSNYHKVLLSYDKATGRLTGETAPGMNADLSFENADLADFLRYFFMFIRLY